MKKVFALILSTAGLIADPVIKQEMPVYNHSIELGRSSLNYTAFNENRDFVSTFVNGDVQKRCYGLGIGGGHQFYSGKMTTDLYFGLSYFKLLGRTVSIKTHVPIHQILGQITGGQEVIYKTKDEDRLYTTLGFKTEYPFNSVFSVGSNIGLNLMHKRGFEHAFLIVPLSFYPQSDKKWVIRILPGGIINRHGKLSFISDIKFGYRF